LTVTAAGISSLSGPVIAGVFLAAVPVIAVHAGVPQLLYLGAGAAAISIGRSPNGLAGYIAKAGENWRGRAEITSIGRSPSGSADGLMDDVGMKSVG
jgi:hypothetical protein